jgi:predicted Fe-S protein YdhL (DUF1289 family)
MSTTTGKGVAKRRQPPTTDVADPADLLAVLRGDVDDGGGWMSRGLCAQTDPEAFFPEKGGSTREGKRICSACPVRAECLEWALDHDERFGIWGGLSERERRRLRRNAREQAERAAAESLARAA